ncbi:hypothetical protein Poli38472_013453 [Pythium oligandrum]|uniref:Uncharacterized protein n=1 Tax=Pythium oligandrum TaxID=41045 RepID=A0A8K1C7Q0_PYTOL|nr:hypothetical protein Poli38472_013453 [Pythium oligandrum]|eukprot:TMW57979.1 hypothetical protein Poli38472_013453 [Pythium oligandrum]
MFTPKVFCFALALLGAVRAEEEIDRSKVHYHLLTGVEVIDNSTVVEIPPMAPEDAVVRAGGEREVELFNNCEYEVGYKYTSGFSSRTDSFLPNPAAGPNGFRLKAGERHTASFINNWSGNVGVCAGESCETCNENGCGVANGGPMTRAEWTFVPGGTDYYDVTVINGVNIPVMMEPLDVEYNTKDPYKCGAPGKIDDVVPGSGCSWDYAQFQDDFHYNAVVGGSGKKCTAPGDCSGDEVCGYKFVPGVGLDLYCGERYGWYSANQVCALNGKNEHFNCDASAEDATGKKIRDFHGCVSPAYLSGYQPASKGKDSKTCGCTNWEDRGVNVLDVPETEKCKAVNPKWMEKIVPTLDFLKKGCPTTYTYPYDDMTSTFICGGEKKFRITFCPAGGNSNPAPTPSKSKSTAAPSATPKPVTPKPASSDPAVAPKPTPAASGSPKPTPAASGSPKPTPAGTGVPKPKPTPAASGSPKPTPAASGSPKPTPSASGTPKPTPAVTGVPKPSTAAPSDAPKPTTAAPSDAPKPTPAGSVSRKPTPAPTGVPKPTTHAPTDAPKPTPAPSAGTPNPTPAGTGAKPSKAPTEAPTDAPQPTPKPTPAKTGTPKPSTAAPTDAPKPSTAPSEAPKPTPAHSGSKKPTPAPSTSKPMPVDSDDTPAPSSKGKYVYVGSQVRQNDMNAWCNNNCPQFCPTDVCQLADE